MDVRVLTSCTHCRLQMGPGVKVKSSELDLEGVETLASLTASARSACYEYFRHFGGDAEMRVNGGYAKAQAEIFKFIAEPTRCPYTCSHLKTARHALMEPGFDFGVEPEKLGLQDYQVVTHKTKQHIPDAVAALKSAEKTIKPKWIFKSTDDEVVQTLVAEAAAEEALRTFVAIHGNNFKLDPGRFMSAYREETYDPCTVEEWNAARRIQLLTGGIADLASRARDMAASSFVEDHRFAFEKPGCLRLALYLNGYHMRVHVEEPVGREHRSRTVADVFTLSQSDCADAAPEARAPAGSPAERLPESGDDLSSGTGVKDTKILVLEAELAALKETVSAASKAKAKETNV